MNEQEPVSPFSIGGNRYGEVCEHGCLVRTCELCDYGEMMPDTDRVPTEADSRMAGTLSTIWPMSKRHPEDSIHLAIYVNDILCDEDADREFIGISIAKTEPLSDDEQAEIRAARKAGYTESAALDLIVKLRETKDRDATIASLKAALEEAEGERDAAVAGLEDLRALVRLKAASEIVAALNREGT